MKSAIIRGDSTPGLQHGPGRRPALGLAVRRAVDVRSDRVTSKTVSLPGVDLEVHDSGQGVPLVFLHGASGFDAASPFVSMLSARRRLIAPSHPGFGRSSLPDWVETPSDIAHIHLELFDALGLDRTQPFDLVGCSLGGWIAAEIAVMVPWRIRRLVLVSPVGVKTGPVDRLDIPDIYTLPQGEVQKLLYHDPSRWTIDPKAMSDEALTMMVRNRETTALLTWEPWMHSPRLRHRLHRIASPTLFLRGESDGLVSADYLARYAALIRGATAATIAQAAHVPHLEQPEAFAQALFGFLDA
jgi:pimeloyl-ACP methyl ester carboxylesterase